MMLEFVNDLDREIKRIEEEIALYTSILEFLKRARMEYDTKFVTIEKSSKAGRKMSILRKKILEVLYQKLDEHRPTQTKDILKLLDENNIKLYGKDPVNTLSALLSYNKNFKANGKAGWTVNRGGD